MKPTLPTAAPVPRDKLVQQGLESLSDRELLSLLVGPSRRGRPGTALLDRLLPEGTDLAALAAAGPARLRSVTGLGRAGAECILAAFECARRVQRRRHRQGTRIEHAGQVFELLSVEAARAREERVWILALDARHGWRGCRCVSIGSLQSSIVHPREVFQHAMDLGAAALVLAHNHPSGDPSPSREDHQVTQRIAEAGRVLGIEVLDHVVLGAGRYFSFREQGWMPDPGAEPGG